MKKTTIIALLLCIMVSGCDKHFFGCEDDRMTFVLCKYNTGEQYRNNVMICTNQGEFPIVVKKKDRYFFHEGYIHCISIQEAEDTNNFHLLSFTYDEIDTINDEWKKHYQDYIIPNVGISEMHRVFVCDSRKLDCYYKEIPFCTQGSNNNISYYLFSFDSTIINQMIDNGTLWSYFERII